MKKEEGIWWKEGCGGRRVEGKKNWMKGGVRWRGRETKRRKGKGGRKWGTLKRDEVGGPKGEGELYHKDI